MVYPVYPHSPPPANYDREPRWPSEDSRYETGKAQFSTVYVRPLYEYSLSYENAQDGRRKLIEDFWNQQQGHVRPFFFTDPKTEHHYVGSANIGFFVTSFAGRFYTDTNSWRVIPASGYFTVFTALSGNLTNGVHYAYSQDNGYFTVFTAFLNSSDTYSWGGTYFRKVHFNRSFRPRSRLWGNYGFTVEFDEVLP